MKALDNIRNDGGSDLMVTHDPGKANLYFGIVSLAACLAAVGFLVVANLNHIPQQGNDHKAEFKLFALILSSAGALFFVGWVIWTLRTRRKKTRIYRVEGHDIACYDGYGLLWREPHRNYRQLRWHERLSGTGMVQAIIDVITLDHPRAERCIEIYPSNDKGRVHERSEIWSKRLNLPVMREKADQGLQRTPDELDQTILELAAEERLVDDFELEPAPSGVVWGNDAGAIWAKARISLFFAAMAPLPAIGALSQIIEAGRYLGLNFGAFLFGVPAIFLSLTPFTVRQHISVTVTDVIMESRFLGMLIHRGQIPLAAVVRIYHTSGFPGSVIVEGQGREIKLHFIGRAINQWLTAFLQRSIVAQNNRG